MSRTLGQIYHEQVQLERRLKMNEIIKERVEVSWQVLMMLLVVAAAVLIATAIIMPKRLVRYYLYQDSNNGMAACVYADWDWGIDSKCYCSNNPAQAIEEVKRLNETMK